LSESLTFCRHKELDARRLISVSEESLLKQFKFERILSRREQKDKEDNTMKNWNWKIWTLTVFLAVIGVGIMSQKAASQSKESAKVFYKGKTLKFVVPVAPGGTYDLWARALAPHLEKHTGAKVIVENTPGAAGLVGSAQLYSLTKPDGLTISVQLVSGLWLVDMLGIGSAKFDLDKFTYIGRIDVVWRYLFASKASGFKSIGDMQKATKSIRFGCTDKTSASGMDISIMSEVFGLKSKIIPGFKGSKEYMMAVIAGRELDAVSASLAGYEDYVQKGDLIMVAVQGNKRFPAYPRVPTVSETSVPNPEGKKLLELLEILTKAGRMVIAPPGLPEDRRLFLDKALVASLKEPALIDWAKKSDLEPTPLSGNECKALMNRLSEIVPKAEKPKYQRLLSEKYF
jgi:tripartite-type tricarboxylate transporter receptor subunit TctC